MSEKMEELKDIESYKKAFALNPSGQLASEIADIYDSINKKACAYRYGLKAIKLEPNNLYYYLELFETLHYYVELIEDYNPNDKDTPKKEKKIRQKIEKYQKESIEKAEKILKTEPNDYDVLCYLCTLYRVKGDYDKALDYGKMAFEVDKKHDKVYHQLKYLYKIKEDYKNLLELCLTFGDYHEAGEVYRIELKDYHKAIECYKKAIESDDKKALYYQSLGSALNYIKEYKKATHYLKIAKKLTSNSINLVEDRF